MRQVLRGALIIFEAAVLIPAAFFVLAVSRIVGAVTARAAA
jgi:hypothetical protein